jgi:hypothetical protein
MTSGLQSGRKQACRALFAALPIIRPALCRTSSASKLDSENPFKPLRLGAFTMYLPSGSEHLIAGGNMPETTYVAKARIERGKGPLRYAYLAGESNPVAFSVHGAIAAHYRVNPADLGESHATTIDYVVAAVGA